MRIALAVILVASLAGCRRSADIGSYRTPRVTATPTSTVQAAEPSPTEGLLESPAIATETSPPASPDRARLGGPEGAFVDQIGDVANREERGGQVFLRMDRCRRREQLEEFFVVFDGGRAVSIIRTVCSGSIEPARAETEARTFFPSDAQGRGERFRTEDGDTATRYLSPSFAEGIHPDWFVDCEDRSVPAGTFSLLILPDGWTLEAGTCPA